MSTKHNIKHKPEFEQAALLHEAEIIRLFPEAKRPAPRTDNEALRLRQYAIQSEMLKAARKDDAAPVAAKDMLAQQNQILPPVCEEKNAQAARQENNGSIFSSAFTTFCFR